MKYIKSILPLIVVLFLAVPESSHAWTEFATMKVRGTKVVLYGDKTSFRIDEQDEEERRLWIKLELSGDMKSEYNNKDYRVRKEEYFFDCDERTFAVAHTILLDENGNVVYDSGYHHPFGPGYKDNWHEVSPGSGPAIIYEKVCEIGKLPDESPEKSVGKGDEQVLIDTEDGYKVSGKFTGGVITDGLDVKEVRWASRKGFERFVFDVYKWGGYGSPAGTEKVDVPGYFEVFGRDGRDGEDSIRVIISGYRSFSADMPDLEDSELIESLSVKSDEELASDSGFVLDIILKKPSEYKAFELHKPGRIVVDLKGV